jgi:hypothetical protein
MAKEEYEREKSQAITECEVLIMGLLSGLPLLIIHHRQRELN